MPIVTTSDEQIKTERIIKGFHPDSEEMSVKIFVRTKKSIGDRVILNKVSTVLVNGQAFLELVGVDPRMEVTPGKSFYESDRDRLYQFMNDKGLWPEV